MRLARLAAFFTAAVLAFAADEPNDELRQLSDDNFKTSIENGAWLVEHYSPRCAHCRAFAPTWERLAKDKKHLEQLAGFHMAQVNCLAQGDLCSENNIKGYPQLNLYIDGKQVDEFKEDRLYDFLSKWIDDQAVAYARTIVLGTEDEDTTNNAPYRRPNPDGKVVEVNEEQLKAYKEEGPVFVDFYAPWCGHCKHLRPILEKLAGELRGSLNVVAVNCDENTALCKGNGIVGYPTLRLYNGTDQFEYEKARKLGPMKEFLKPSLKKQKMQPIKVDDLAEIARKEDVFFLYLQNFGTSLEDLTLVEDAVTPFLGKYPVLTANDPLIYKNLSISTDPVPSSILLAFAGHSATPVATLQLPVKDGHSAVSKWLAKNQHPLVMPLLELTYDEFAMPEGEEQPLILLAAVHSDERGTKEREKLEIMARAQRRGGRPDDRPVRFAVVDDSRQKGLEKMYGIKPSAIPQFVVVDPVTFKYYDGTIEGERAAFDGKSAFSVIEGVFRGWAKPKAIHGGGTMAAIGAWSAKNPLKATVFAFVGLLAVVYVMLKFLRRDVSRLTHGRGGYMNEKGTTRLD